MDNRIPFPPDPNPRKPRMHIPSGAWDTHFHAYGPPHLFPYAEERHLTPLAAPIEHYLAVAQVLGFERGVVVQSLVHGDVDTRVTQNAIAKSEGRLRGIVRSNPKYEPEDIRRLHATGIRGMRMTPILRLGGQFDQAYLDRIVGLAAVKSWVLLVHVDAASIIQLADVIRRIPGPVVIENYALVDGRLGVEQPAIKTLLDLAKEPNIWLKLASAYRMRRFGATYEQIVPVARAVAASSPDRVIFGTDWPHSIAFKPGEMPNDGDIVDMLLDFVPDETARHKLLVDNPKRLFDFD